MSATKQGCIAAWGMANASSLAHVAAVAQTLRGPLAQQVQILPPITNV